MDANSFYEMKQSPAQALEELRRYLHEVWTVNGRLITLWHNTFLGSEERFNGWGKIYREFLEQATGMSRFIQT